MNKYIYIFNMINFLNIYKDKLIIYIYNYRFLQTNQFNIRKEFFKYIANKHKKDE